jgi:hypothetical protein
LAQLLVDGLLVALAYVLAFWLRFAGFGVDDQRYVRLLEATLAGVVVVTLLLLAAFGQYQRLWRFNGRRNYEAILKAVLVATIVIVGAIALLHPVVAHGLRTVAEHRLSGGHIVTVYTAVQGTARGVLAPASIMMLFFVLSVALLAGARFAVLLLGDGQLRSVNPNHEHP